VKKHIVRLSVEERTQLTKMANSGRGPARTFTRVRILLKADQSGQGPAWSDEQISQALDVTIQTVERVRRQLVEDGLEAVLSRRDFRLKTPRRKIDGDVEAHLVALACSKAPEGRARWTLRLLADSLVELGFVLDISHEAVRQTLKKTKLSLG
jgi:transposase